MSVINIRIVIILFVFAGIVRFYGLSSPKAIVFDELHFGGFASKYIKRVFFFDVHPPLGKLLLAATGYVAGYNGTFEFSNIGTSYSPEVPYIAMRMISALFGVLLVPMAYATMRNLSYSSSASVMSAVMVLFENGLTCQSRLILLDSFLVFFAGMAAFCWSLFIRVSNRPFTIEWWSRLLFVGVSLGLVMSVKWVGLFTIATIGVLSISQLWVIICNGAIPLTVFYRHLSARVLALVLVPISVYCFFFYIHFAVLTKMGPGSAFMSPEFQSVLQGNLLVETYPDIAFGSRIMFRHEGSKGGYLHSHPHSFPGGSKQQQVTCYPHKDQNSDFLVKKPLKFLGGNAVQEVPITGFERIVHGSKVRLEHIPTSSRLHSHSVRPGFTDDKEINEATCYGSTTILGDANDDWIVEIEGVGKEEERPLLAIVDTFRLKHAMTGCYLSSRDHKLPEWAFGQQEVVCSAKSRRALTIWRVENAEHPEMPKTASKIRYRRPSFFEKFIEIHKVMWFGNQKLTADHPYESRPVSWPLMSGGISFWRSTPKRGIYFIGNPFVWTFSFLSIIVFALCVGIDMLLQQRRISFEKSLDFQSKVSGIEFLTIGFLCHYLPFFLISRQASKHFLTS